MTMNDFANSADSPADSAGDPTSRIQLDAVRAEVETADVFGICEVRDRMLACAARESAAPAWYRLRHDAEGWHVELVTADRWLSESIEADLMHFGDPIEELIEEELVEMGVAGRNDVGAGPDGGDGAAPVRDSGRPTVLHYRSEDMLYTFRTPLGNTIETPRAVAYLLAYEAAFRELGDMQDDGEA